MENKETRYACPMHCEDDKIYNEPGRCPVCNMKLVPLEELEKKHGHKH